MDKLWIDIVTIYGPLALGWVAWAYSEWERRSLLRSLQDRSHAAIVESTRVIERLATLIEERTRSD